MRKFYIFLLLTLTSLSSDSASSSSSLAEASSSLSDSCFRLRPLCLPPRFGVPRLGAGFFFFAGTTSSSLKSSDSSDSSSLSLPRRPRPFPLLGRPGVTAAALADFLRSPSESEPPPDGLYWKIMIHYI